MHGRAPKAVAKRKDAGRPSDTVEARTRARGDHADFIALQSVAGNRAVSRLVGDDATRTPPASGQPLDPDTRASMESRFGIDLGQVRVHTDTKTAESARELDAWAYTIGSHVAFGDGQYAPHTAKGRGLIAHEVAHVASQQTAGASVQLASKAKETPPPDLDDPAIRGKVFQPMAVDDVKRQYESKGYRVLKNEEWKGWLQRAFKTGVTGSLGEADWGPEMVAIHDGNKKIVTVDITATHETVADIKTGERTRLPEGTGEIEKKHHLEKTIEAGLQVGRNLPRNLKGYTVTAIDWYREDPDYKHSREIEVWRNGEPVVAGAQGRGPARPPSTTLVAPTEPVAATSAPPAGVSTSPSVASAKAERAEETSPAMATKEPAKPPPAKAPEPAPSPGQAPAAKGSAEQRATAQPAAESAGSRAGGQVASKQAIEPFTQASEPYARPAKEPLAGGHAVAGAAQLLVEVEHALEALAAVKSSRLAGSLRTFLWWLQRGIEPQARGVTDKWNFLYSSPIEVKDEYTTGTIEILKGVRENKFDGIEIDPVSSPQQYEAFEAWVRANVHDWDDFYRHFVSSEDAGVRWVDGEWKVNIWKWSDVPPANVYKEEVDDERITALMQTILQQVLARTREEIEARGKHPEILEERGEGRIAGRCRFRKGRGTLYDPSTQVAVYYWNQWTSDPLFYEMAGGAPPEGYVFVSGADLYTQLVIHDMRVYYGRGPGRGMTIESSESRHISEPRPFTGWGPFKIPVILVEKESLVGG